MMMLCAPWGACAARTLRSGFGTVAGVSVGAGAGAVAVVTAAVPADVSITVAVAAVAAVAAFVKAAVAAAAAGVFAGVVGAMADDILLRAGRRKIGVIVNIVGYLAREVGVVTIDAGVEHRDFNDVGVYETGQAPRFRPLDLFQVP